MCVCVCVLFRKEGVLPVTDVATEYVHTALIHDELVSMVKYTTNMMLKEYTKVGVVNQKWRDIAIGTTRASSLLEIRSVGEVGERLELGARG